MSCLKLYLNCMKCILHTEAIEPTSNTQCEVADSHQLKQFNRQGRSNAMLLITTNLFNQPTSSTIMLLLLFLRYWFPFACLRQKDLTRSRATSRADGSMAKVMRSQFFNPTAIPGRTITDSSLAKLQQKSTQSAMPSK